MKNSSVSMLHLPTLAASNLHVVKNTEKGTLKKQTTCKTRYFGKMLSGAGIKREMPFIDAILASVARMRCET
jgi:hypothetical protein